MTVGDCTCIISSYVLWKIEFSAPSKRLWIQATCAFFSLHGVPTASAAIVPHTPPIHISTLPALVRLIELVWTSRMSPVMEQVSPKVATA